MGGFWVALLSLVGVGALVGVAVAGRKHGESGEQERPAPNGSTPPEAGPVVIRWTKASVVLEGFPDPYNAEVAEEVQRQKLRATPEGAVGTVQTVIRTGIGLIPVIGQIFNLAYEFFNWLGGFNTSKGGFDGLPKLVKQRIMFYKLGPNPPRIPPRPVPSDFLKYSDTYNEFGAGTGPFPEPRLGTEYKKIEDPQKKYEAVLEWYFGHFLYLGAREAEFTRITRTDDEVCLPAVVCNYLYEKGLWPPPIEPLPLSDADFEARYGVNAKARHAHPFIDWAIKGYVGAVYRGQPGDIEIARRVRARLQADYEKQAAAFRAAIDGIVMPPDLAPMAVDSGCMPRYGSAANPIFAPTNRL